jgi:hypothetical protein
VDYNRGKLTTLEAKSNFFEMYDGIDEEHRKEVKNLLWEDKKPKRNKRKRP